MNSILGGRRYSPEEIAVVVRAVFEPDWNAINAVAIALAESGGWSRAVHLVDEDPDSKAFKSLDLGMWQTNTFWNPDLPVSDALTPEIQVFHVEALADNSPSWGYNWALWNTYKSGAFKEFLPVARDAVNKVSDSNI